MLLQVSLSFLNRDVCISKIGYAAVTNTSKSQWLHTISLFPMLRPAGMVGGPCSL